MPVVDTHLDDEILSSIPDSHSANDRARDTRRSTDDASHAVSQNKRSNSSSGICRKSYESKVIRPLQNRRKEHDCIKEITDETVTMSSDKSTNECSSLLIPRSSDRSKQKTLDTVDCHRSPSVLLTPATTQNKSKPSSIASLPVHNNSGEHITLNSTRRSGENIETMSQREPRANSLPTSYSSKRVSFAKDIQSDLDSDNDLYFISDSEKSNLLSKSNLSLPKQSTSKISVTKSNLKGNTISSKSISDSNKSNVTCVDTGITEGNIDDFKYLIGKIHRDNEDYQRYVTDKVYVDRESRNIVGERILILKDGRRNRSRDPYPIHIRDIEEMTRQYEQESSPLAHQALIGNLLETTLSEEETATSTAVNNDANFCLQGELLEPDELTTEQFSRLLLSRMRGDELVDYCLETNLGIAGILTPSTRKQAINSPQKELWLEAERKEIDSINNKKVLQPAQRPHGKKLLRTKWVYKIKYGAEGELSSYKVRLVACGYSQVFGIDFDETYSPVIRLTSMRLLFAISAQLGLKIHQMDVNTAFLHADIQEEIYITPPDGFPLPKGMNCFRLKKALYGLKQAPREWYNNMNAFLLSISFKRLYGESCLYYREDKDDGTICIISLYVDDLLIAGSSQAIITRVKNQLKEQYDMKDLGVVRHILGCEVKHEEETGTSYLTQFQYTKKAIEKFFGPDLKPCDTPADVNIILSKSMSPKTEEDRAKVKNIPYREAVGTLLWLSLGTRPDISYAVSQVAKYNDCYGIKHWEAVKRIYRYLKGSMDLGLKYSSTNHSGEFLERFKSLRHLVDFKKTIFRSMHQRKITDLDILEAIAFADSDLSRDIDSRRSQTGFLFFLGSCLISWQSKQQASVALSSMEAENMSACACSQEGIWLKRLLEEFGCRFSGPLTVFEDNMACIFYSRNPGDHQRTKHIDQKYHFVREQVAAGNIILQKIKTDDNLADLFTKPLSKREFYNLIQYFMHRVN